MTTPLVRKEDVSRRWWKIDAEGKVLGRLAARIATILQGKHKPLYMPYVDNGDYVVVTNVARIKTTGSKLDRNIYTKYTGFPGGLRKFTMREAMGKDPEAFFRNVVRRMLPKRALGARMLKKLKIHKDGGPAHGYGAQKAEPLDVKL